MEEKWYKYDICGITFKRKDTLKRHTLVHNDVIQYACNICNRQYKTKLGLKLHVTKHH